ncbi:MAG: hypothetical protein PF489_12485, partial [Salinivirgaceae bacterium]|nr:hypothetical protein [Salinivirgaceae bacterium]
VMLIHLKRRDKLFLKSHFSDHKILMLSEYIVLSVPFISCFLIHKQWVALSELSGLLIIVNLNLKAKHSNLNTKLQKLIPDDAFEWKAGLRKQFFIVVPVWMIAAVTSFFVGSVPIAIFIIGISTLSFFDRCEPFQVLLSYELSSQKLLLLKIKRQLQLFSILVVPLLILFLLFNFDRWYIPIAEYFIFCCLHVYTIMTKYAFFEPNIKSPAAQIFFSIGVVGGMIPIFLPVIWLLTIWFYVKSVDNLNFFLNDYN